MASKQFQQSMVNQDQEIIFEVVKLSGNWVFPAASSIVEATKGKNMYLRLTDDGESEIFRLDSVKDGENAGEKVYNFVGNGGMDLVAFTAVTDGAGNVSGTWEYAPGEGPAGEAVANIGNPLQWKGPATVAQLNAGITGIQPGWTYTLTDAGTLTDGSVTVDVGDEVAWTEDDEWFKVCGDSSKIAVFDVSQEQGKPYPTFSQINSEVTAGKTVALRVVNYNGSSDSPADYYYLHNYRSVPSFHSYTFSNGKKTKSVTSLDVWSEADVVYGLADGGSETEADLVEGELSISSTNSLTKLTLTTVHTLTVLANAGMPNFALEIDNTGNSNDVTVMVKDSAGTTTLNASAAGGNTVGAGKYYQLTCVGNCWTLAEFEVPTP